jgi:dienelactone hydrolase
VRTTLSLATAVVLGLVLTATGSTSKGPAVTLVVSPAAVLLDQPVAVQVRGLRPGRKIALEATTQDTLGKRWHSRLVYKANRKGVVDTRSHMRLFWSLEPVRKTAIPPVFIPAAGPTRVVVRAVIAGRSVASGEVVRREQAADVSRKDTTLANEGFVGTYFAPAPGSPRPAVLQLGGSFGSYGYLPASLLASHGYPTLALAYFKEPGLPQTLKDVPLEYFAKALRWLAAQPGVDPNRVLIYGVSRGGEAALLVGAAYPELVHGVFACTPSADVNPAFPGPGAAWTLGGQPVPLGPIPVWQIAGPVFATGGGRDLVWPSAFYAHEIVDRARAHGRPDIVGRVYPDAGHGVGYGIPNLPVYGHVIKLGNHYIGIGGTPGANVRAWAASWPLVLRFIRTMPS